ncbi:hypothetical protein DFQ28_010177 [Apophysomyces sp. BC1034]|nr:hypothetical protein DFQ29_008013 [Apophysomyces sp. BC1021]KAG0192088.1 hypothetical protein DFQ28_010177 [Apophysomyces sp. BC1034]
MDIVNNYGSSDEEENLVDEYNGSKITTNSLVINTAPDTGFDDGASSSLYMATTATELTVNVPYDDMTRPSYGPENPFSTQKLATQNILTGHVETQAISEVDFRTQHRTFETYGYARDPSLGSTNLSGQAGEGMMGTGYVGNLATAADLGGASIHDRLPHHLRPNKDVHKKREKKGDSAILEGENAYKGPWAGYEFDRKEPETVEPEMYAEEEEEAKAVPATTEKAPAATPRKKHGREEAGNETTTFHGTSETDYLGRTYMAVPQDLDINLMGEPGTQNCFIPKRCIHTWDAHPQGVSAVRLLPKSGHLVLSAGMDNKLKIFDFYHNRSLLRTIMGHTKAIRDIAFNNDGRKFLSASYDRYMKLWDTETGKLDKLFDTRSGDITQEYDQHLGPVNSITFVDDNRRFITTSDDKTMRAWEFDIPVVIKYIAEPDMHSMPAVTLHPSTKWLACQSLDNQILIYGARDRFRMNRKKRFAGHLVAGYACKPGFSADGRFLSSGDSNGNVWTWDWKSCKILKKFKAHEKVVMNTEWHPHETSKMVTCSWDGKVKLWD